MAITKPKWVPANATLTSKGWELNGEVLAVRSYSEKQINEYNGVSTVKQLNEPAPAVGKSLTEAPVSNVDLDSMTKVQLEALARTYGVDYTSSTTKAMLTERLRQHV